MFFRMGWDASLPQLPYGPRFRKQRRLILDHFNRSVNAFQPTQRDEAYILLRDLLETPDAFLRHIRRWSDSHIPCLYCSPLTPQKDLRRELSCRSHTALPFPPLMNSMYQLPET